MAPQGSQPKTPDEWVSAFVAEMAQSRDVGDAHERAARALASFEAFVVSRQAETEKNTRLEKENAVLKRAVGIQNQRLQEAVGAASRAEAETAPSPASFELNILSQAPRRRPTLT